MSKKRRKSKKRSSKANRRPPLCVWDKVTYSAMLVLVAVALVGMMLGTMWLQQNITFADPEVVASAENISTLWAIVPFMAVMFVTAIPLYNAYADRKPIWGPKEPPPYVSPKQKEIRKYGVVFVLIVVLICLIPYPWSLFGRTCLRKDGSIVRYNMFNQQTTAYASDEITDVRIEAFIKPAGKYSRRWVGGMQVVLTTDRGKEYVFDHEDFRREAGEKHGWLKAMMKLKAQYPQELVHYGRIDLLEKVIEDQNLTPEEIQLLYQLFALPS